MSPPHVKTNCSNSLQEALESKSLEGRKNDISMHGKSDSPQKIKKRQYKGINQMNKKSLSLTHRVIFYQTRNNYKKIFITAVLDQTMKRINIKKKKTFECAT